ncbi:MAG: TadE/TadG family type IV pilus assembly protein [Caldilineaceae bacterium]
MSILWREDGQDLVEYALIFPLLILILLGILEFGILFFDYSTIANAAREGARAGILPATTACNLACRDAAALTAAQNAAAALHSTPTIAVTHPSAGTIQVTVTYNTSLITGPMIAAVGGSGAISLHSVATMRTE